MNCLPRVYVDFDDVLCETARELTNVLSREFGRTVAFEDIRHFDLSRSFGLTPQELSRFMDSVHRPEVLLAMEPVADAASGLERWRAAGIEICIVTGRPPSTREASLEWLSMHGIPYNSLLFVDKYLRAHRDADADSAYTLEQLRGMRFSLAVDDSPDMIRFLVQNMSMPVAVFSRPWNADPVGTRADVPARVCRCRSWLDLMARFPNPGA